MRGLALELGPHGVTANAVAPGWIATGLADARGVGGRARHADRTVGHA